MKIQPVSSPHQVQQGQPDASKAADAKARAMAAFNTSKAQPQAPATQTQMMPVANPSQVSAEEMSAIRPPTIEVKATQATEVSQEAPKEEKQAKDPSFTKQYEMLAKRERQLRQAAKQQDAALKAREEAVRLKEAEIQANNKSYEGYISRQQLKDATLQTLAEAGVSYDDVVQQVLNTSNLDPRMTAAINELKNEIKSLKQENDSFKKSQADTQDQQYQAAIKQIEMDARQLIAKDPSYEAIRKTRSTKDVVELIQRTFEEEGRVMSVQEAAEEVETYLVDQLTELSQIEKIQKRRAANQSRQAANPPVQSQVNQPTQQKQPVKTLTNANTATRKLSSRERALRAFRGEPIS